MDALVADEPVQAPPAPAPGRRLAIDEGFPRRVLRMSLVLTAIAVVYACLMGAWRGAIGLGAGGVIGAAAFVTLAWMVGALVGGKTLPGWRKAGLLALVLVKLPLLGVALWYALYRLDAHPLGLLIGLAMTQIVMVLKVAGMLLVSRSARGPGGRSMDASGP